MKPSMLALFGLALFGAGALAGALLDQRVRKLFMEPRRPSAYLDKLEHLEIFPPDGRIAFVGDSLVERGSWGTILRAEIANFGVGGDTAAGVLGRIDDPEQDAVVVLVGINDLLGGRDVETVARTLGEIVSRAGKRFLLVELLPTHGRYGHLNDAVVRLNRMLPGLCSGACAVVPVWERLAEDGALGERYSRDGLHLNADGYRVLGDTLRGPLETLAGE